MQQIHVYGADWCHDTKRTLSYLDDNGVPYNYRNIENDADAEQWVKDQNGGKRKLPTVQVGGQILSVPSEAELTDALRTSGIGA